MVSLKNYSDFRHRISLKTKTSTPTGDGCYSESWNVLFSTWAEVEPLVSYYKNQAIMEWMQVHGRASFIITMRYRSTIAVGQRVEYLSRDYEILGVEDIDQMKQYLRLYVREV